MNDVRIGAFFECSWGYDQTNVDFYKVIEVSPTGKTVKVQMWSSIADDNGRVVPGNRPASYPKWVDGQMVGTVNAPIRSKRLRDWSDRPAFTVSSYSNAYLWDGRAAYQTPIGAGH